MVRKQKILIGVVVVTIVCFVIILIQGVFSKQNDIYVKTQNEGDITRYEWMEMLCEQKGLTEFSSQKPYFSDVTEDSTYFNCIQSAVEWDVLKISSKFEGEECASGRFIALTAMKTIGENKVQQYLGKEKKIKDDTYIKIAIENELIRKEELTQSFSKKEAENILEKLNGLYFGIFWQDDMEKVEYRKGVMELAPEDILQGNADATEIKVADESSKKILEGDILVFEQGKSGLKIARKVVEVQADNIIILSADVELDEVLKSLVVSDITEISADDILAYYGISKESGTNYNMNYLAEDTEKMVPVFKLPPIESKGYAIKVSAEEDEEEEQKYLKVFLTSNDTGLTYELPIKQKVNANAEYFAEINIDKMVTAADLGYEFGKGVEYAEVVLDAHAELKGGVKMDLFEEQKFRLFETMIPFAGGVVGVKLQLYLVVSAEGAITIEAEMPMGACVRYEKDKGIRNYKPEVSVTEPTIKVDCEANLALRGEPILAILKVMNVLDAEADIGVTIGAEEVIRPNGMVCTGISTAFPVINLTVCGDEDANSFVGWLGLSAELPIIEAEDAPFQKGLHYESVGGGKFEPVDECTYDEAENSDEESSDKTDGEASDLSAFYGYDLPLAFDFDYEADEHGYGHYYITDTGSFYLVKGTLICPEFTQLAQSSFVTGSGHRYTQIGEESYNQDQRQKIILLGDDGKEYEVSNLPAFLVDMYTGASYYMITSEEAGPYVTYFENVYLRIDYDTYFTDGKHENEENFEHFYFDDFVKGVELDPVGPFCVDIHFTDEGKIDIFNLTEAGSKIKSRVESSERAVIWREDFNEKIF